MALPFIFCLLLVYVFYLNTEAISLGGYKAALETEMAQRLGLSCRDRPRCRIDELVPGAAIKEVAGAEPGVKGITGPPRDSAAITRSTGLLVVLELAEVAIRRFPLGDVDRWLVYIVTMRQGDASTESGYDLHEVQWSVCSFQFMHALYSPFTSIVLS